MPVTRSSGRLNGSSRHRHAVIVLARRIQEVGWVGDWRGDVVAFRFQPPPIDPGMRFSRTRLTDVLHRRCSTGARQGRFGLGAMMVPLREISPSVLGER